MKYVRPIFSGILIWLVGSLFFVFSQALLDGALYSALSEWLPDVFPSYNPITEKADYERLHGTLSLISAVLLMAFCSVLAVRFDNERGELMIAETEGFYTVGEGAAIYYPAYFLSDIVSALIIPAVTLAPACLIPDGLTDKLPSAVARFIETLLAPTEAVILSVGEIGAAAIMVSAFLVGRLLGGLWGLDRWRAEWLSDVVISA